MGLPPCWLTNRICSFTVIVTGRMPIGYDLFYPREEAGMNKTKMHNTAEMLLLILCLGAVVAVVLWLFIRIVSLGSMLVWETIPEKTNLSWIVIPLCAAGGCVTGVIHKKFGDYPEELPVVLGKVKRDKHYDYHPMLVMLVCALLPLIFGSSVGPEAGLTGIIAGLCYWIGDNVTFARHHAALCSEIGEAVTLGQLFHSPLFGILAVEEEPMEEGKPPAMPKLLKLVFYGLSIVAAFLVLALLNKLFHTSAAGFPSFSEVSIHPSDYALVLLYIPVGIALYLIFEKAEKYMGFAANFVPVILRETLCGVVIGLMGLIVPMVIFSGEEEMAELMDTFGSYTPFLLICVSLLKIVMTAFCLKFGMKGGHFFPLIFACCCMGFGLAMLFFPDAGSHVVFAAGVVTSATLGAQLKKPLAVSVLMLLCFPARLLFWIFLAAALGGKLAEFLKKVLHSEKNSDTQKT